MNAKLEWYFFEHSYLLDLSYNILGCTLTLKIDAKVTFDHPKCNEIIGSGNNFSNNFIEIAINFEGVQYFRSINSLRLLTDPNDDAGSVEQLELKNINSVSPGLSIFTDNEIVKIYLKLSEKNEATFFLSPNNLTFLEFVSEMVAFEIGFESYTIVESEIGK